MTIERIKEIQKETAYPDSISVQQALLQVWNECQQQQSYSDLDIENIIAETWIKCVGNDGNNFKETRDNILKQFKKK